MEKHLRDLFKKYVINLDSMAFEMLITSIDLRESDLMELGEIIKENSNIYSSNFLNLTLRSQPIPNQGMLDRFLNSAGSLGFNSESSLQTNFRSFLGRDYILQELSKLGMVGENGYLYFHVYHGSRKSDSKLLTISTMKGIRDYYLGYACSVNNGIQRKPWIDYEKVSYCRMPQSNLFRCNNTTKFDLTFIIGSKEAVEVIKEEVPLWRSH